MYLWLWLFVYLVMLVPLEYCFIMQSDVVLLVIIVLYGLCLYQCGDCL